VLLVNAIDRLELSLLLDRFGLELALVAPETVIPGSFWGEREAGLIGSRIYARLDTPLHSVLHEGAHFICMTPERRAGLHTDAGGDDAEESAVCYLQILLAQTLRLGHERMCGIWTTGVTAFDWAAPRAGLQRTPRMRARGSSIRVSSTRKARSRTRVRRSAGDAG
jgi:hypothetical protein